MAIIVTLLIFEVRLPAIPNDPTTNQALHALGAVAPKFIGFAISFFTVAIFWVNHHHFMDRVRKTDAAFLWLNNFLLFFLTIIPFTTAMLGDHPTTPVIVSLYALNLCLAGGAFSLLGHYTFFGGKLVDATVPEALLRHEWRRSWIGTLAYLIAALAALTFVPAALLLIVLIPLAYVVPTVLGAET